MLVPEDVRINVGASFPTQVIGAGGITVTKQNGVYTIGLTTPRGQTPGTITGDNAAPGNVGEYISVASPSMNGTSSAVTISVAAPAIVSWPAHGMVVGCPVYFTTTGTLPTGLSPNTRYWVSAQSFATDSFAVATSIDNALAGISVATTGAGSGTHTALSSLFYGLADNGTSQVLTALRLSPGDWDVTLQGQFIPAGGLTTSFIAVGVSLTTALDAADGRFASFSYPTGSLVPTGMSAALIPARMSLSAPTTIYGIVLWSLGVAGGKVNGKLRARRMR